MTQRDPLRRELIVQTLRGAFGNIPRIIKEYQNRFKTVYMASGLITYIDNYVKRASIVTAVAFPVSLIFALTIFGFALGWGLTSTVLLYTLVAGVFTSILVATCYLIYPFYKRRENKAKIDNGLIYFLSYMTALSASGMPIDKILDRITEVETNPPLILLAKKFLMDVKLFGMDVRGALKDIALMCPSPSLAKIIEGIRTVFVTSGDLKGLLTYEVSRQIEVKQQELKAKVNTLVYIGELYVAIMVVTPILFIIIISILSILGTSALGGNPVTQMNLLVFIGIPLLGFIFTIILDQTLGSED